MQFEIFEMDSGSFGLNKYFSIVLSSPKDIPEVQLLRSRLPPPWGRFLITGLGLSLAPLVRVQGAGLSLPTSASPDKKKFRDFSLTYTKTLSGRVGYAKHIQTEFSNFQIFIPAEPTMSLLQVR